MAGRMAAGRHSTRAVVESLYPYLKAASRKRGKLACMGFFKSKEREFPWHTSSTKATYTS